MLQTGTQKWLYNTNMTIPDNDVAAEKPKKNKKGNHLEKTPKVETLRGENEKSTGSVSGNTKDEIKTVGSECIKQSSKLFLRNKCENDTIAHLLMKYDSFETEPLTHIFKLGSTRYGLQLQTYCEENKIDRDSKQVLILLVTKEDEGQDANINISGFVKIVLFVNKHIKFRRERKQQNRFALKKLFVERKTEVSAKDITEILSRDDKNYNKWPSKLLVGGLVSVIIILSLYTIYRSFEYWAPGLLPF